MNSLSSPVEVCQYSVWKMVNGLILHQHVVSIFNPVCISSSLWSEHVIVCNRFPIFIGISYCRSNPCVNGTCWENENGYMCTCEPGWTGVNCDLGEYLNQYVWGYSYTCKTSKNKINKLSSFSNHAIIRLWRRVFWVVNRISRYEWFSVFETKSGWQTISKYNSMIVNWWLVLLPCLVNRQF